MSLSPGTPLGPYRIVSPLGAGGMGEVYRARDERLGRDVAIKVLPAEFTADPERLKRFEREAKATAALSHPNILDVHDVGTVEGVPYLVEELLEGESLRERLARGPIPVREAVEIAVQVAHGLAAAHGKHIVHRDLKPGNVFITEEGTVKIVDFGLAKLVESVPVGEADTLTQAPTGATDLGRVLGTAAYMAPEQARGMPVDERADIFALGVVLYEMLSGERPFRGETATDTVAAILTQEPPPLPEGVPPALQRVVTQCLAKRPDQRFSSAHDLALALRASAEGGSVTAPRPVALARPRRLLVGGAVLAATAVVAGLAIWRPWRAAVPVTGSNPERIPSILALPCKVYGTPEVAFLTDAVPGTLSTLLAQVEGIDTKVPPTSFEVEKVKGNLGQLAELYEVSSFIITSITTSPGRFTLNVQLVDAATRKVRWGNQYEGPRETYNDLARQAAEGIRLAVRPAAPPVPTAGVSSEAELAFRKGTYFANRFANLTREPDFGLAVAAFTRALERDASFASAAAEIARLYVVRFEMAAETDRERERQQIEVWARRALDVDPRCGAAWDALRNAEAYRSRPNIEKVFEYVLLAVSHAPRDPWSHHDLGRSLYSPGSEALALAAIQRARELDPLFLFAASSAAFCLEHLGRTREALAVIDQALVVEPQWPYGLIIRGEVLAELGRFGEAAEALERSKSWPGGDTFDYPWPLARLVLATARNETALADRLATQVLRHVLGPRTHGAAVTQACYWAAPVLARQGRTEDAMRILMRGVELGRPPSLDWLLANPGIQLLRGDPRFARVLATSRDGAGRIARILKGARARGELPSYLEQPLDELQTLLNEKGARS